MSRHIILAVTLPAAPDRLFDMYLDADTHTAFTGAPVIISPQPGSPFSAFNGQLTGKLIHTEPKRLIVQAWRSVNWPKDASDSVLVLTFCPEKDGGRIELLHANVPDVDFAGVSQGWVKYYWNPWRAWLTRGK